jgi:hypothetical protein
MQLLVRYQKDNRLVGHLNDELGKVKLTLGELGTGRGLRYTRDWEVLPLVLSILL